MYHNRSVPQTKAKKRFDKKTSSLFDNKSDENICTLHKTLTSNWKLNGPDVRRILLNKDKTLAPKNKRVIVSADPFKKEDKLSEFKKGTASMRRMSRFEQMHRFQSALQKRILVHKSNDKHSVVYASQIKAIRRLMEFLNLQLETLTRLRTLKPGTESSTAFGFFELKPSILVLLLDNFYKDKKLSRSIDDKMLLSQKAVPSSEISVLRKGKREILVDKLFESDDKITDDFSNVLLENETDIYFLLGFPSRPSVKQLLGTFRNGYQLSLKSEQDMYHLFRLSVLSNILIEMTYSPKCLL